jgi:hypothetical protein
VTTTTITFSPALPCSTISADGAALCGKDATVGTLYPMGGGQYILQPICRECVAAMQRNYADVERHNEERSGEWEPDGDPFEDARKAQ